MLAKANRLRSKKDYDQVFQKGQRYSSPFFSLTVSSSPGKNTRFGIIISTNISKKATIRNLLKRRIRTIIREHLLQTKGGVDISLNCRVASLLLNYSELEQEIIFLFKKANLLNK